ncbi:conjugative transposon protein TraM [Algoriphagus sp. D3-2-R+10]|uniref:conjugative transposon protein TraM n=1 Tax=Algoriphagus aurantiacus TaxID=3103948 RepID=UPI002B3774F5|nr:conjugative transposon protein TraM [Algoriphagus sp. D3-2-R+10]MEB2774636.1 conjugative transposon protein TraM [Algoriphagus sp. D3-2-R+10]
MTNEISLKTQQKRKFLLILPLLTLPFLTLTFWAMGGGSTTGNNPTQTRQTGINLELPGIADNKSRELDKLGHYQKSRSDSAKFLQEVKNDPYYRMAFNPESTPTKEKQSEIEESVIGPVTGTSLQEFQDPNEKKLLDKLEALNRTLAEEPDQSLAKKIPEQQDTADPGLSSDLDRLDQMMQQMQAGNAQPDPEMQQMGELLEKILDIQHPERVQARLRSENYEVKSQTFSVVPSDGSQSISSLESANESPTEVSNNSPSNGFYGLDTPTRKNSRSQSIRAVIHETQTLSSGATIKLRLTEETTIKGLSIPKDQLVYGIASLNGDRLGISIQHIRVIDQLIPVDLTVHNSDGMEGIHIPGSLNREVGAQSGNRAIQGFGINAFDTSLEAQAASAGIETAKSLIGKKIKQVQFTLKAGYQVWLNDQNNNLNH